MPKNEKSQLYGQIFMYILTIVIVSIILLYGYSSIQQFRKRTEQVSIIKFENDMKNSVESISGDFGSVARKDISAEGLSEICFVESMQTPTLPSSIDPLIKDQILSNTGKNVFLMDKSLRHSFYAGKISVEPDVLCITPVNGVIPLRLEGKGDHALVSRWS